MNFKQYRQSMTDFKDENPVELDKILKFSNGTVQRLENGMQDPRLSQIQAISSYFKLSTSYLIGAAFKQPTTRKKKDDVYQDNREMATV
jgi:transcriptional regulator with XRE-family HTH domain